MAQNASDSQKVDYLWKKIVYGAAKTDISGNIDATNEPNPSPLLIRGDKILQQASLIANVIPGSNSSVVTVYPTTFPVECISTAGIPTPTLTWQTGQTFWIPPEFGSTYQIKVYIAPSGQAANVLTKGTQVFATGSGNNDLWVFDYQAGILNFNSNNTPYNTSNLPISFTGNSVYISGAVYSGTFGLPAAVSIGNLTVSNTTISTSFLNANIYISPTGNGTVQFGGNLAVGLPSGNILQRPTSPIIGYVRYNTETQQFEIYNGTNWVAPGAATITSDVITPDGVGNTFTLSSTSTTTGVMVNINGTMQQPFTAYNVSGTSITFTEIPLSTDIVEVRHIVIGAATVSAESLILGATSVILDTAGNVNVTGNLVVSGNYYYANGQSIFGYNQTLYTSKASITTNASIIDVIRAAGNTAVNWNISSIDNANNNFKSAIIGILSDGANVYQTEYGIIQNNQSVNVAVFVSNISAGNIYLWAYGDSGNVSVAYERTILGTTTPSGYMTQGTIGPVGPAGPAGTIGNTSSNIQTSSTTPSVTTSTGALVVAGGAGIGGNLNVGGPVNTMAGNLTLQGSLQPSSNISYDLGTPTQRWRTGYFSASTLDLGGSTISVTAAGFTFNSAGTVTTISSNGAISSNTLTAPLVTITGNLTVINSVAAPYFVGSAQFLTGLPIGYSNVNAKAYTETIGLTNYSNVNIKAYTETIGLTNYSNVNIKAYTETIGLTNYSNVNAVSLVTSLGHTNYSNVNLIAYLGGSVTVGNLTVIGNISSVNVEYVNVTEYANSIQAGNISAVTFGNVGATFIGASLNVSGNVITTGAIHNALAVNGNTFISSLGVGTSTYGNVGEIRATNAVISYFSDERLKTKLGTIENALDKVDQLSGFYYEANDVAQELGYTRQREVGVSAQETQAIMPEIVRTAPISDEYLTVQYERFAPLLIEAIKELRQEISNIKKHIGL
jgi:hypothetical protein